jgi:uncharacterized protein (TIGR02147 family)
MPRPVTRDMKLSPAVAVLSNELKNRQSRNSAYSLRAFAQYVGISPASLSKVLKGKQNLSEKMAERIARRLGFSAAETEQFCLDVTYKGESNGKRASFAAKIRHLDIEEFKSVAQWHHFAILEWISLRPGKVNVLEIADSLGLLPALVRESLERLVLLKYLKLRSDGYHVRDRARKFGDGASSRAIREYHAQMISKAEKALTEQPIEKRNVSNAVLKISAAKYTEAITMIATFRDEMAKFCDHDENADSIYSLNIQFFLLAELPDVKVTKNEV